jgi:septum formation protein
MVSDTNGNCRIILASSSPRRRQLLRDAGITFIPAAVDCEEIWPSGLKGKEIAEYLASVKADAYAGKLADKEILITADTIVWCHGLVLGKPADAEEAAKFLRLLSGCDHEVITGLCLTDNKRKHIFSVSTMVTFRELSEEEIGFYVREYKPFDKAGAYGIQEWIGLRAITRIAGSYYNVVGMPVSELCSELLKFKECKY